MRERGDKDDCKVLYENMERQGSLRWMLLARLLLLLGLTGMILIMTSNF